MTRILLKVITVSKSMKTVSQVITQLSIMILLKETYSSDSIASFQTCLTFYLYVNDRMFSTMTRTILTSSIML